LKRQKAITVILKVGVFAVFVIIGLWVFGRLLIPFGIWIASALSVFAAAGIATAIAMRIYERQRLVDVGFYWGRASVRNLLLGLAGGAAAGLFVVIGPLLEGAAVLEKQQPADWGSIFLLLGVLIFGGIGEELLFHGYAFQVLMGALGPFATILPVSVLFALAHSNNLNVSNLALVNTGLWGVLLGFGFYRSGDLWLPIGMHVGWNWVLPLFGTNLSGFTMNVTGYSMRWNTSPLWSGGAYGPEGGLLTTAAVVLLFVWVAWKANVRRQTPPLLSQVWEEM
jgi:membrane protease YdiL (CAAX protease family)